MRVTEDKTTQAYRLNQSVGRYTAEDYKRDQMKPIRPTKKHNDAMKALIEELCTHVKEDEMLPAILIACKIGMLARVPYMERIADMEIARNRAPEPVSEELAALLKNLGSAHAVMVDDQEYILNKYELGLIIGELA